jgi:hypothetical protein
MTDALVSTLVLVALWIGIAQAIDHSKPTLRWVERRRRRYVKARALYEAAEAALAAHQRAIQQSQVELARRVSRRKKTVDDRQAVLEFGNAPGELMEAR